jgi:biotin transport system substrate-specific component
VNRKLTVRSLVYVAFFTALTAVSSYISIPLPFSPVPFTAQTLAVMLTGLLLPPTLAGLSMLVYLLLGAIGAPVFSSGASGIGVLMGNTGGFLIGFMIGAMIISIIKGNSKNFSRMLTANIVGGMIVVYALGAPWLNYITGMGLYNAFYYGALLWMPTDLIKALIAIYIAKRLMGHIKI